MKYDVIGRVTAVHRYPVKSMRGEALTQARVWWHGIEGDRRYAFVRSSNEGRFPWLTARELPRLLHYSPAFVDPADPVKSTTLVTTPAGVTLPVASDVLRTELEHLAGEPLHLLQLGRGTYDSSPLSLLSTAALTSLSAAAGQELDATRFRGNIIVETEGAAPFPEDGWLGRLLVFGSRPDSVRLRVIRPIPRCAVITIDPRSTRRDPAILRAVAQCHEANAGVYAIVEATGSVEVGDEMTVLR